VNSEGWWFLVVHMSLAETELTAAGGVPWRPSGAGFEIALVHRGNDDDWCLPTGRLQAGEHVLVGAHRYVARETGCDLVIGRRLPIRRLDTARGPTLVAYWTMRAAGSPSHRPDAVDRTSWVTPAEARQRLSHSADIEVIDAMGDPREATPVLLVRHASAGDPNSWPGDDWLRPLDEHGWRQAQALRHVLKLFGDTAVASVPNGRCLDTLAALAADLGVAIHHEPNLEETAYLANPHTGCNRIRALARPNGAWAVCSQGKVIPDVVARLATHDGLELNDAHARKGSLWALFFASERLTAADYYPDLL
jgi:phosphohistidine phosphatase SixA/ADP-ribose pyrophosphatase YjhB (NUDIX family)